MASNGTPGKLLPRQRRAIVALLTSKDVKAAAELAKVGERTLYRWMQMPAFRLALLSAEGDAIDQATRQLITLQGPAIDVIAGILADQDNHPAVRLRAAQSVLDYLLRLRELRDVESRLAALEAKV
jgi:hypothetical protein